MSTKWQLKLGAFFIFFCFSFSLQQSVFAYSNPVVRVLLFKAKYSLVVQSKGKMKVQGLQLSRKDQHYMRVQQINSKKLKINSSLTKWGSIHITSTKSILVGKRNYVGSIEIKPFEKGLYIINHIDTERYLEGVLNAEISTRWHQEAVKAQTIIARTFVLYKRSQRLKEPWHVTDDYYDQVYKGTSISDWLGRKAIRETRGLVVTHGGQVVPTFYHSNSGGMTEDPAALWNNSFPHIKPIHSPYGKDDPRYYWQVTLGTQELNTILQRAGLKVRNIDDIYISQKTSSNRAYKIAFTGRRVGEIDAQKFRKLVGYTRFRSLLFQVVKIPGGFRFYGTGNGHGVGLSQWGAKEMAERGHSFEEILSFYYQSIRIRRFYG